MSGLEVSCSQRRDRVKRSPKPYLIKQRNAYNVVHTHRPDKEIGLHCSMNL